MAVAVIACLPVGQYTGIEVEMPGKKPSFDQIAFIENVVKQSPMALMMRSRDCLNRELSRRKL